MAKRLDGSRYATWYGGKLGPGSRPSQQLLIAPVLFQIAWLRISVLGLTKSRHLEIIFRTK